MSDDTDKRVPLGFFDASGGLDRERAIEITNRIRLAAGGEPLTEAEIAAADARFAAKRSERD